MPPHIRQDHPPSTQARPAAGADRGPVVVQGALLLTLLLGVLAVAPFLPGSVPAPASPVAGAVRPRPTVPVPVVARAAAPAVVVELPAAAPTPPPPPSPPLPPAPPPVVSGASRSLGDFTVTCYALRGRTATGQPVHEGGVAADPAVAPYGTRVHIEGVGWRTANDTGGSLDGRRLDIWKPSTSDCVAFGRRVLGVHV